MSYKVKSFEFVKNFSCLGAECEDTCCRGWGMQVDHKTKEKYEKDAPELLDAITSGEAEIIMKRDPETDYCVKFDNGLCSIHKDKGTEFLGNACHFYPRITRKFDDKIIMSAALSCPEIVRSTLFDDNAFNISEQEHDRIPVETKNYLEKDTESDAAEKVITSIMKMVDDDVTPERTISRIISIASTLKNFEPSRWAEGIDIFIKMVDGKLVKPEENAMDTYNLMVTLAGLIHASKKTSRPRFDETFQTMEKSLGIEINRETLDIMQNVGQEYYPNNLKNHWEKGAKAEMEPILKNWIKSQLAMSCFPFSGFGNDLTEKVITLSIRFATVKLALMCHMDENHNAADKETIIRVIQSLSRFLDHLSDPELSIKMYEDAGWTRESRLRGLVGDID